MPSQFFLRNFRLSTKRIQGFKTCAFGLASVALCAWSPRVHESQTRIAARMLPSPMAALLAAYPEALIEGARGVGNDLPPTAEDVEDQFARILAVSEAHKNPRELVKELGRLGHMVQELTAPGSTLGVNPLRDSFEAFADERLKGLVVTRESFWSLKADLDPKPEFLKWAMVKFRRHEQLLEYFDSQSGHRKGQWDELSVPFALLQLSFSNGTHATANIWILAYRATGDLWAYPSPMGAK